MKVQNFFKCNNDLNKLSKAGIALMSIINRFYNSETAETERIKESSLPKLTLYNCVMTILKRFEAEQFPEMIVNNVWAELKRIRGQKNHTSPPVKYTALDYNYNVNRWYEGTVIFGAVYFMMAIEHPDKQACLAALKEKAAYNDDFQAYFDVFEREAATRIKDMGTYPEAYEMESNSPRKNSEIGKTEKEWIVESTHASWRLNTLRSCTNGKSPEEKYQIYLKELYHEQNATTPSKTYLDLLQVDMRATKSQIDSSNQKIPDGYVSIDAIIDATEKYFKNDVTIILNALAYVVAQTNGSYLEKIETSKKTMEESNKTNVAASSRYHIGKGKNTDFAKIISAMYDVRLFETANGQIASNKQDLMNVFGKIFNANLESYSTLLSRAKQTGNYLDVFDKIKEKARIYYESE